MSKLFDKLRLAERERAEGQALAEARAREEGERNAASLAVARCARRSRFGNGA